jgi:3-oxoacyl-[acyl-carrier-protein] synthase II
MYITASSTISHQPTFRNKGFSSELSPLNQLSSILHPDYTDFIPPMSRRRMTDVLKMAIACTKDCLEQRDLKQPDAIIVGTSMGCNVFTKSFLDTIISSNGGLLSPTSFILSTHNTIAGQISLLLGNHDYNMTHTQNSLSFEQALIDGILCLKDSCNNVLENTLYNMKERLNAPNIHTTCGASFFILSNENSAAATINLIDVGSYGLINNPSGLITDFLYSNDLSTDDVDLLLYSNSTQAVLDELTTIFPIPKLFDYQKISGSYFTNSAFAMDYSVDILLQGKHPSFDKPIKRVLICNNLIPENLGLILLDNNEVTI